MTSEVAGGMSWDIDFISSLPEKYGKTVIEKLEFMIEFRTMLNERGYDVIFTNIKGIG